jgi:HEAT repeat protein
VVEGPYRTEIFPGGQMLPLDVGLAKRSQALEGDLRARQSLWSPAWLPLFQNDQGQLHVISTGGDQGPILLIDFVELPVTVVEFPDLGAMASALLQRWRTGAYQEGEQGAVLEEPRIMAALYRDADFGPVDIDQLLRDLADGSPDEYSQALLRMRTRLYGEAVPGLITLLQGPSRRGRISAAELLGDIGDSLATGALKRSAEDDTDPLIRAMAVRSLRIIESRTDH